MATILIVEDDANLRFGLEFNLRQRGHVVVAHGTGEDGLGALAEGAPDLMLLDVMLPGISGLEVLEELGKRGRRVPVMMLTARSDESDAVVALSLGADDYVRKPFGVSELMARIDAVLRRSEMVREGAPRRQGEWSFDLANLRASGPAGEVTLTATEVEILELLLEHPGEVARREDLLARVWGADALTPTRTLDNHVARLRKKLERDPQAPKILLTVHGVGYKLSS